MEDVPTTDRVSRHHGDDRFRETAHLDLKVENVQAPDAVVVHVAVIASDALVSARAEGEIAGTGEDDDPDLRVVAGDIERIRQLEQGLGPERVPHLGPVDRDLGDAFGRLVEDVSVLSGALPIHRGPLV